MTKKLNKSDTKKKNMIEALENTRGIVSDACKIAGVSRTTHYDYYKQDKEYSKQVDDIQNIGLDLAESKLYKLIEAENVTAIIFYLKTKGRVRGYSEHVQVDNNINAGETGVLVIPGVMSIADWESAGAEASKRIEEAHREMMESNDS